MNQTAQEILKDISKKIFHPAYLLAGEESYFIDIIADKLETEVLSESEKEFNLAVLYGRDVNYVSVLDQARRYPMMSNFQVIIIREAQDMDGLEQLASYIEKPVPSTILVLCHKNKTPDKRKALYKSFQKNGIFLESKHISLSKIPEWINGYILQLGYTITTKATMLIAESVGNDISKITNEISKLIINIPKGSQIQDSHIESSIGISKEYNVFELLKAMETKNIFNANKIIYYFASNPKENSIFKILPILFDFFVKVLLYHELPAKKNNQEVAAKLSCSPYMTEQYKNAAAMYSRDKAMRIIGYIRDYDLKAKGVDNASATEGELLKELIYKILH